MFAKISRVLLCASLFVPLIVLRNSYFPFIAGKAIAFRTLIELALLFFLIHALIEIGQSGKRSGEMRAYLVSKLKQPMVIAVAIFGVIFLLSAFTGVNPHNSMWSNFERGDGAFQLIHYVIFFILLILLFPDKKSFRRLLYTNVFVSILTCVYAIGQLINNGDANIGFFLATGSRVSGTLGNPSYLAAYILINLAILTYFFLQRKEGWWRITWGGLFIFEVYVMLNTGTRAAFLALVIGIILACIMNAWMTKKRLIRLWLVIGLAVSVGLVATFFATRNYEVWSRIPIISRLVNFESATTDVQPRLWTWTSAVEGVAERPLLGYGAENFAYAFDAHYNPKHFGIESFFDRTHNIFLEYLITGGVLLLLAWLSIFYFYYRRLMKRAKDFWWSVMFIVPIIYVCQGSFLFDTLPIYLILFLFLAFSLSEDTTASVPALKDGTQVNLPQIMTVTVLTATIAYSLFFTSYLPARKNYLLTQALMYQGTFSYQIEHGLKITITPQQITNAFASAVSLNSPVGQEETIAMFQRFVIFVVDTLAKNPEVAKNAGFVKEIRALVETGNQWFDNYQNIFPAIKESFLNGGLNLRFGLAFKQPDLTARGHKILDEALTIAPKRLEIINLLIEVARIEKDQKTFDALIAEAKSLRPDLSWQ